MVLGTVPDAFHLARRAAPPDRWTRSISILQVGKLRSREGM